MINYYLLVLLEGRGQAAKARGHMKSQFKQSAGLLSASRTQAWPARARATCTYS